MPLGKGADEVFYPGEMEAGNDVRNRREGLLLPADTLVSLSKIARETDWFAITFSRDVMRKSHMQEQH